MLWLWKTAAWSMGLSTLTITLLGISGYRLWQSRHRGKPAKSWLYKTHPALGKVLVFLTLLLWSVGFYGTVQDHGHLRFSAHFWAGSTMVLLVCTSAWAAFQIPRRSWARSLHLGLNSLMVCLLFWVLATGWVVVQPHLPASGAWG
jgi:Protein of unknown function (DUF4079)